MSLEPTCDFCGYSDKLRCKTQDQANSCLQFKEKTSMERRITALPKGNAGFDKTKFSQLALTCSLGQGKFSVETHQAGVADRLKVTVSPERVQDMSFTIQPTDIDNLIDVLTKARNYVQKGTL